MRPFARVSNRRFRCASSEIVNSGRGGQPNGAQMGLPCRPRVDYRGYAVAVHRRLCYPHGTSAAVVYGGRGYYRAGTRVGGSPSATPQSRGLGRRTRRVVRGGCWGHAPRWPARNRDHGVGRARANATFPLAGLDPGRCFRCFGRVAERRCRSLRSAPASRACARALEGRGLRGDRLLCRACTFHEHCDCDERRDCDERCG